MANLFPFLNNLCMSISDERDCLFSCPSECGKKKKTDVEDVISLVSINTHVWTWFIQQL